MHRITTVIKCCLLTAILGFAPVSGVIAQDEDDSPHASKEEARQLVPNRKCLKCHDDEDEKIWERDDGSEVFIYVEAEKFEESVHGDQHCQGCHANVELKRGEHDENMPIKVSCVDCHMQIWKDDEGADAPEHERLGVVVQQIESYMDSVHAKANRHDQTRTNAACHDCHDAHNIGTIGSEALAEHRLKNPEVCGRCHEEQKAAYLGSVHGREVAEKGNADAAVCSDCHTTHNIVSPDDDRMKLTITKNCGDCHESEYRTYLHSYHGQVNRLGYTHTAKCYDCHGSHDLQAVDDPTSMVHRDNRLETCNVCHEDAPAGFLSFHAHGDPENYEKYPAIYITAKFMTALIIGVFLFFWTHVILWFYRELRDRKQGKGYFAPEDGGPVPAEQVYFQRFSASWRVVHLLFAISTMILVLTGSTLLFSHTNWAKFVIAILGGPETEAIIHRTAAVTWLSVFLIHFFMAVRNIRNNKSFRWFGPTSMIPNWQDLKDVIAMFKWFFGFTERPTFDRWSYWQKFDYWAPFWGAGVIGLSGIMLFAPTLTAGYLPGFVFNVATIVHAEEALLATMFLFTVHFFNAHFRPDKFPMSTTIFTGAVPLEEFKHEHKLEYERLKASGELDRYLVKRPSRGMRTGSNLLAAALIFFGLTLLVMVLSGYIGSM